MSNTKLPPLLKDYLNYNINLNKSTATVNEYRYDLVRFLKYMKFLSTGASSNNQEIPYDTIDISKIDSHFLECIDASDIYEYLSYLKIAFQDTATTRARKIASIKGFFRYLNVKIKVIEDNPAKEIETPKLEKTLPKYLTITESERLLDTVKKGEKKKNSLNPSSPSKSSKELTEHKQKLSTRDYAIVTLFLNCGMRLSELVGINLSDMKLDESILKVTGKGNKQRTVYLNKACENAITNYLKIRPVIEGSDKDALFLSERKKRISRRTVQACITQYLEATGLHGYSVHKLRHTAATLMYQHGVDVRALQEILGHENIGTTEIYTHVDNYQIRQAIENNPLANYQSTNGEEPKS